MKKIGLLAAAGSLILIGPALAHDNAGPSDAEIAHIAYTAGAIDVAAGKQALAKSHDAAVRSFAEEMVRDHQAVNDKALALVKKLHVTPAANGTSSALSTQADATLKRLALDATWTGAGVGKPADPVGPEWRAQVAARNRADPVPRASGPRRAPRREPQVNRCLGACPCR